MMIGRLILISKDKSETPTIENTRPITILPAITKFFESTILHNLERITASDKFCKNQRGFTKGKSTLDNIAEVLSIAKNIKSITTSKEGAAMVFFDFYKAYDSVPRDKLISKLTKLQTP